MRFNILNFTIKKSNKSAFLIMFGMLMVSCSDQRESALASYKSMVESVYSSVTLEPENNYVINTSVAGYLVKKHVKEGDEIKKGNLLFELSSEPIDIQQQNANLNYKIAKDNYSGNGNLIEESYLELRSAKLKMQNDSLNLARFQALFDRQASSKLDYDNAKLNYEISKNNYISLKKRVQRLEKELKNQTELSKNNIKASDIQKGDYQIRSKIDGKLYKLNKDIGEFVTMQEPLAIAGDAKKFRIKMLVDEVDIAKIQMGQKVLIALEAYKNKIYEARVVFIAPKMEERTQTFEVEAQFSYPPSKLYMGLTGEGNIIINEMKKALVIPRSYLLAGNKVETESGLVKVKTGVSNWEYIEILEGLKVNTKILKPE